MEGSLPNWANETKPSIVSAAMLLMSVPEATPNSVVVLVEDCATGGGIGGA